MTFTSRHIGFIVGFVLATASFFFFARMENIFGLLLITGFLILLISWGTILFKKGTVKAKLFWTSMFIVYVAVLVLLAPIIIDSSYRIYIVENKVELSEINSILKDKQGDIEILNEDIRDTNGQLTSFEKNELLTRRKKISAFLIHKSDNSIFYGLSGYLDVRLGMRYWTGKESPGECRHLTGSWFR